MSLTSKDLRELRAAAHHLNPVVQIGHAGVTDAVVSQVSEALAAHELIKVKLGGECPTPLDEACVLLAEGARAEVAQTIGKTIVLYRRRPQKPKVHLTGKKPAPKARRRQRLPEGAKRRAVRRREARKKVR